MLFRAELRPWLDYRLKDLGLINLLKVSDVSEASWNLGNNVPKSAIFEGIFTCLCCGEPAVACRLALSYRMSHLASCLSMAAISDPLCKRGLQRQLRVWNELKVTLAFCILLPIYLLNILTSWLFLGAVPHAFAHSSNLCSLGWRNQSPHRRYQGQDSFECVGWCALFTGAWNSHLVPR